MNVDYSSWTWWQRFWHEPVRAERLAITRIFLALALLTDQLFQYWPHFEMFYGPEGVAPEGTHDEWLLKNWHWTILLFNTDNLAVVSALFWTRVGLTVAFLAGFLTRVVSMALWFLTLCFVNRNPALRNGAEDVLMVGLFLLMLAPCGRAFSVDCWLRRCRTGERGPFTTSAWPLRLIQIQVCMIYLSTGLAKLIRSIDIYELMDGNWLEAIEKGTWWMGTSIHYVLNDTTMSRWSYAELPLPFWMTAIATYLSVGWETLFPILVMCRWTRKWALWFGVLFHLGIYLTIEVGWFGFYTVSLYGVWIPGEFWDRLLRRSQQNPTAAAMAPDPAPAVLIQNVFPPERAVAANAGAFVGNK
jgi:hypothetical protein